MNNNNNSFKIELDRGWFKPMYKNKFHKFLCEYMPFIFKPNKGSDIIYGNVTNKLVVLSGPKAVTEKIKNPWYKFWLPKYAYTGAFSYEVKLLEGE
jgi:hypothetical protein